MRNAVGRIGGVVVAMIAALPWAPSAEAQQAAAPAQVKLGIVSFLTGPAASPFGIPGRNAAEILIEALNAGSVPAPYNTVGFGGARLEAKYVDEVGSTANQVTEFRNLVQRDNVDAVVGYVSSGSCLAVAPVAEELKELTVLYDCGTPRIFEEGAHKYVFRVTPHATMDSVAAARYATHSIKDISTYSGLNQNYAWGQDSWRDFVLAMKVLAPKAGVDKELFPKLFAGEYGAEISALLTSSSQFIHSSFYDGDLEAFVFQATARGLLARMPVVMTTAEAAMLRLGAKLPDGTIIGGRGPHGMLSKPGLLNDWFQKAYTDRYGVPPTYPSYHMAQSILGLKSAWDKAAAGSGTRPGTEQVIAAFEGITFQGPSATIRMALGKGHQGISDISYGTARFNKQTEKPELVDVIVYPAECVNPPDGMTAVAWLEGGMKGAACN